MQIQADLKTVEFQVGMSCGGCANACKRILGKIEGKKLPPTLQDLTKSLTTPLGVTAVETDVEAKRVVAHCAPSVNADELLQALQKWGSASGKSVELIAESA